MSQDNPQTAPASHVDLLAVDALFRRIAERGRKVRAQKQLQAVDDETKYPEPKEVKHKKQLGRKHDNHK